MQLIHGMMRLHVRRPAALGHACASGATACPRAACPRKSRGGSEEAGTPASERESQFLRRWAGGDAAPLSNDGYTYTSEVRVVFTHSLGLLRRQVQLIYIESQSRPYFKTKARIRAQIIQCIETPAATGGYGLKNVPQFSA